MGEQSESDLVRRKSGRGGQGGQAANCCLAPTGSRRGAGEGMRAQTGRRPLLSFCEVGPLLWGRDTGVVGGAS